LPSSTTSSLARHTDRGRGLVPPPQEPSRSARHIVHSRPRVGGEAARRGATGSRAGSGLPRSGGCAEDRGAVEGGDDREGLVVTRFIGAAFIAMITALAHAQPCQMST